MPARFTVVATRVNDLPSRLSMGRSPFRRKSPTLSLPASTNNSQWFKLVNSKIHELKGLQNIKIALKESPLCASVCNTTIYRYASFYSFNEDEALEAIFRACNQRYLHLEMTCDLLAQFQTKTLFPLPVICHQVAVFQQRRRPRL